MTRRSPPTERVIRLLGLLAAHPGEPMTFSEIARRVEITKATCHALLLTLTDAGYLIRDPTAKTYTLGPTLVEIGHSAQQSFPTVQLAHDELEALSRRTGHPCLVTAVVDDHMLIVDRAGVAGPDHSGHSGQRIPFAPPFGALAVAWSAPDEMEDWIDRSPGGTTAERRAEYRALLDGLRRRGYAVFPLDEAGVRFRAALSELADDVLADDLRGMALELLSALRPRDYLPEELEAGRRLPVNTITAPVFDDRGRPDFLVCVQLVRSAVPVAEIESLAGDLLAATARMTRRIGGRLPEGVRTDGAPVRPARSSRTGRATAQRPRVPR